MPTELAPAVVHDRLQDSTPVAVLDIRPKLDYTEGHIEWATRVPRRELEHRLPQLVPDRSIQVILVDRTGDRGPRDAAWHEFLGYETVDFLEGGMAAWRSEDRPMIEAIDDVPNTAFNVPSKRFGERVHVERDVPALSPDEFDDLRDERDVLVADVRTPEEYRSAAIPDAVNLEGVNLARNLPALRDDDQPVVVNCAGRTRSIIGTATLKRMGLDNVYELENGTMGWQLAGFDVERGADRHVIEPDLDADQRAELEAFADELLAEHGIPRLSIDEFARRRESEAAIYAVDVRSTVEYREGHIPGTRSIPGGQAIQTTDEHFPVTPASIVFVSETHVRAAVTAYWFAEMGFDDLAVLDGGIEAWTAADRPLDGGTDEVESLGDDGLEEYIDRLDPATLDAAMDRDSTRVLDIDASWRFADRHVPGARWIDRYEVESVIDDGDEPVLVCRDGSISALAAAAIGWDRNRRVPILDGGVDEWAAAGYPVGSGRPEAEVRDDFEKPWDQGEPAMESYLEWEIEMGREFAE